MTQRQPPPRPPLALRAPPRTPARKNRTCKCTLLLRHVPRVVPERVELFPRVCVAYRHGRRARVCVCERVSRVIDLILRERPYWRCEKNAVPARARRPSRSLAARRLRVRARRKTRSEFESVSYAGRQCAEIRASRCEHGRSTFVFECFFFFRGLV